MKRRDMYAASVAAYKMANQLSDAEIQPVMTPAPAPTTPAVKRGALCVDESPDVNAAPKKARSLRKESWSREAIDKLAKEAVGVINKLFIATPKAQASEPPPDPRLQNLEFVKAAAIRKYVKRCAAGESELNLDVLNNVVIHANAFVREQRTAAAEWRAAAASAAASSASARTSRTDAVFSGQIRIQLSQLIVSLWRASCLTKHFQSAKKGSDSFKPFAAGILYSLKRGLYLDDGTCVVPALEELAAHLPALRSASSTPAAKQLQQHRRNGLARVVGVVYYENTKLYPTRTHALRCRLLGDDAVCESVSAVLLLLPSGGVEEDDAPTSAKVRAMLSSCEAAAPRCSRFMNDSSGMRARLMKECDWTTRFGLQAS